MNLAVPATTADHLAATYIRFRQRVSLWEDSPPTSPSSAKARYELLMQSANEFALALGAHCEPDDISGCFTHDPERARNVTQTSKQFAARDEDGTLHTIVEITESTEAVLVSGRTCELPATVSFELTDGTRVLRLDADHFRVWSVPPVFLTRV